MLRPRPGRSLRAIVRGALLAVLVGLLAGLTPSTVAWAHTDFESSAPADQEVVAGPLDRVTLRFTNPAEPAGDGFELLDPDGAIRTPDAVETAEDGRVFVLRFEPPLTAGTYGLRWQVRAGDAHPIEGGFAFTVQAPATTSTAPPSTLPPATSTTVTETTVPSDDAPATTGAPATSTTVVVAVDDAAEPPSARPEAEAPPAATPVTNDALDEFLDADRTGDGIAAGRLGRLLTFLGTVFGVGALAMLIWVVQGRRDEIRAVVGWIRLAGLAIVAGGFVEFVGVRSAIDLAWSELLTTEPGVAIVLKLAGGLALWFGFHDRAGRIDSPALSAATAAPVAPTDWPIDPTRHRWEIDRTAALGLAGCAALVASFWFDGHTVSRGPWLLHGAANLVHVVAAAIWAGGVITLAILAVQRRRDAAPTGIGAMFLRFSSVATVALILVIGAGAAMTILIIDDLDDLWTSEWGRLLLVKIGLVSTTAVIGAYNHYVLRPQLERGAQTVALAPKIRSSLLAEAAVFLAVIVVTAWLVGAAT